MKHFPYLFLAFSIAYQPLSFFFGISPSGRLLTILAIIYIFFLCKIDPLMKNILKNKLCLIWIALIVYHLINAIAQGIIYDKNVSLFSNYSLFFSSIFNCYFTMVFMIYTYVRNPQKTIKYTICGYLIFILFAYQMASLDETTEGERLSGAIYSTQFAQAAGIGLLIIAFSHYQLKHTIFKTLLLAAIPILAIIFCGSRNGFGLFAFAMFTFLVGYIFNKQKSVKKIITLLVVFAITYYAVIYILDNTILGERLLASKENAEEFNLGTGTILDYLGERGIYYVIGWENFINNPIFGIGLFNFINYNKNIFPLHTEYMTHITEGGICGSILFFSFIAIIGRNLYKNFRHKYTSYNAMILSMFLAYLIVGITAREFYYNQFYPMLGLCVYFSEFYYDNRKRIQRSH